MYYMRVKFISKSELALNEFELLSVSGWVLWQTVCLSRVSPVPRRMTAEIVTCSIVSLNIINIWHAEEFGRMNPKLRMKYFIILGVMNSQRKSPWYAMSSEQYYANAFSYPLCLYDLQRNWEIGAETCASIHANTIHKTKTEFHSSNKLESQDW